MSKKDPNVNYEVENPEVELALRAIADKLKVLLPHGWGFSIFLLQLGEKGSVFYISSVVRADFIKSLEEFLERERNRPAQPADKDGNVN